MDMMDQNSMRMRVCVCVYAHTDGVTLVFLFSDMRGFLLFGGLLGLRELKIL